MQNYQELLGETFDQMTEIGSGGGGTVFRAHHKRLDKEVVLKKIHTNQLKTINRRAELDILKNLKNNYIPQIIDFIEYGDAVYTVMEYIPGQSFAQLLKQNVRFSQKDVVKWMRQLCEVVDYLHSQKPPIIHCDIKPANVMLTPQGDICLIDFNISGVKTEEGIASIGYSDGYAPVEQFAVVAGRFAKKGQEKSQGSQGGQGYDPTEVIGGQGYDQTELVGSKGYDQTELVGGQGYDRTELVGGQGYDRTELVGSQGYDRTELVGSKGYDQTELVGGQGYDRTELVGSQGYDRTELVGGQGYDQTELVGSQGYDRTELVGSQNYDGTVIESGSTDKMGMTSYGAAAQSVRYNGGGTVPGMTASAAGTNTRSRIRSMSDADWESAVQVAAYVGSGLMIDERTDIYSVGATLYHILCGVKPQPFYRQQIPVKQINENVSDSIAYVIEKAMALKPADRFKNSGQLLKTVRNMGTVDKRYKALSRRQLAAAFLTGILTIASAFCVSFGISAMAKEEKELYRTYIEEMEEARENREYDKVTAGYEKAVALMEGEAEAYFEMAMAYYEQRQYEEAIDFLSREVYTNAAMSLEDGYGRFYFITASCYFELEDYNAAISYYERAVVRQSDEVAYYRDYVVALARNGQIEEAEAVLREAAQKEVSADVMSLLNGEIALLRNDYQKCETDLLDCIRDTDDAYVMLRAYSKLDEAYELVYQGTEQYDKRIGLLTEALNTLPSEYQITLMERLAQVYIDYSDVKERDYYCESAIALFRQMEDGGYATFTARYNVAVLYEKMGRYEEAYAQLNVLLDRYPDNYVLYKRMAFLELDIQAAKANEERDYHEFEACYKNALELYGTHAGGEDMEMLSLQQLYDDVVTNGWL